VAYGKMVKGGRGKGKKGRGIHKDFVKVRMPWRMKALMEERAAQKGMSLSEYIRFLVHNDLQMVCTDNKRKFVLIFKAMKKVLSFFFLLFVFLAFKNTVYAMPEGYKCWVLYRAGDYKKAIEVGKIAVKKYPNDGRAYGCLGEAYFKIGELELALDNLKKAVKFTRDKKLLMLFSNDLGLVLRGLGFLDDALSYFDKALNLAKDLRNTEWQANILNNIGTIYLTKGELDKALSYFKEALSLTSDEENVQKVAFYNNIAVIYREKGEYQKAIEYLQKAIEIHEKYGDHYGSFMHKLHLGETYRRMKDYEKAEKYLSEGLEGAKMVGNKLLEAMGYWYLGRLYRDKEDKEKAKEYYTRAYDLYKSIGSEGAEKKVQEVLKEMKELDISN
jgi:tetratricopeptide (TPR) repeat protein